MTMPDRPETPWAVICYAHGRQYLTREEYDQQMWAADHLWVCPVCYCAGQWDDDNFERFTSDEGLSDQV